jgi:prepilin-type N-terminal cleavage/methylation domain-containing protein
MKVTNQAWKRARAGFSMIELMVAMVAGSFVITGAYYMSDVSSRIFGEQLRRSEAQMSLRAATELLRRDIGRAAFLSIRDTYEVQGSDATVNVGATGPDVMAVAPRPVFAATVTVDGDGRQQLILTGNMTTTDQYFVSAANATDLVLQTSTESFKRSFIDPADGTTYMPTRFLEAFFPDPAAPGPGRMVSVTELERGRMTLRELSGAVLATTPPTLQLKTPLPMNAMGNGPFMNFDKIVVAPVSTIRYAMQIPGTSLARVGGRTYMSGGSALAADPLHPVLVRSELDAETQNVIPGTERVVLDSIVANGGFTVEAIWDNGAPPAVNLVHTITPETLGLNMGKIRSLIIQVIVETEQALGDAVSRQRAQSARRALRFEVMMPNTARNSGAF